MREVNIEDGDFDKFEVSSGGVVYFRDSNSFKFVLLLRQDNLLTLPKGHVEPTESPEEAALREIGEETGISVTKLKIVTHLGWFPNPIIVPNGKKIFKLVSYFLVEYQGSELPDLRATEHRSGKWYVANEINHNSFAYTHTSNVIERAVKQIESSR